MYTLISQNIENLSGKEIKNKKNSECCKPRKIFLLPFYRLLWSRIKLPDAKYMQEILKVKCIPCEGNINTQV